MKIKILKGCSGRNFSYGVDQVVEVSEEIGKDLVEGKLAEEIKPTPAKTKAGAKPDAKD